MREFVSGAVAGVVLTLGAVAFQAQARQTVRTPQFENDTVKVWRTIVPAHSESTMHRHDHPRVVVALSSGRMDSVDPQGGRVHQDWEAGHAYWLAAMAPGTMHADGNPGDRPMDVVVVEMRKEPPENSVKAWNIR